MFIYLNFEDTKTLGLKLFQVGTNLTTVSSVEAKVRKLGLKLRIEKTKVATLKWRQKFKQNYRKILFKINFFQKPQESKVCPKKWAYFSSKWAGLK